MHPKKSNLKCESLSALDVYRFHKHFYKLEDKQSQDNFLLNHITVTPVQRRCITESENMKYTPATCSAKYYVRNESKKRVPVYVKAFIKILHLSKDRLQRITKQFHIDRSLCERRRGVRETVEEGYKVQKNDIKQFISKLQVKESHYCRGTTLRKYLPSELNIEKLFRMYTE